ncbi:EAL domain-containing protein [Altererythrobacter buctensis]|uniref:EAL domain-containing protein n=2 Tax=Alteraurantiacibacter buctensis TaxID=1503981 RepID=A0A844Z2E0_9SPHN|nr:EAL domain-containing protein [Alteraurantiacibacter buctensis]
MALFRLDTSDGELAHAQFRSFSRQMPLLYAILVCNAAAIMIEFYRPEYPFRTVIAPLAMCAVGIRRAIWWYRQKNIEAISDAEISALIRRTCSLAVIMTLGFEGWCMWIYPLGDAYARGHLTFFLALTQVSSVFCLMSMRAAALRVALASTVAFVLYFSWIDDGKMIVQAIVLSFVGAGMMVVTHRYNLDFSQMIRSGRDLRWRQIETERLSEENRRVSLTDALSGLPNRRHLLGRLDTLDALPPPAQDTQAVIFIDLDGFKDINDAHGHHAGDTLISCLAARLRKACPGHAMLTRVGGDEFAILIEVPNATFQALSIARHLAEEICLPVVFQRHVLQVGASIGIASNLEGQLKAHELLRRADIAMYHCKSNGKGEIALYDKAFDEGRLHRMLIEEQIARGLVNDEFDVFYQPVVDGATGSIVAAEALIRWPRRREGQLDPDQFIAIAEATGQIHPLGALVLRRACQDFVQLPGLRLSVNVSPAQFRDPGFERQVAEILQETGFPPDRLQLEITEGYLLAQPERAIRMIGEFKAMGISVALDDFGTGFTSIHYLQSYGFSHIKIDKSLVSGLQPGNKASLLVAGAILLAKGLDMEVIAEGVECVEQADLLRKPGCDYLQGYMFGRPLSFGDFSQSMPARPAPASREHGVVSMGRAAA